MGEREKGGKWGKKSTGARERACSEEVVEVLEKRGEEKDERRRTDNGRAVTENEEHNKRTNAAKCINELIITHGGVIPMRCITLRSIAEGPAGCEVQNAKRHVEQWPLICR